MKINIETIDHKCQPYDTVGMWTNLSDETKITVSDMRNDDYAFCVAVHELLEAYLCRKRGITTEDVDSFDLNFKGDGEPGDDPAAPYRKEHFFSTTVERMVAAELGVDWQKYEDAIEWEF